MRLTQLLGLLLLPLLAGCNTLSDARGQSEFCEVHHALMTSMEVPAPQKSVVLKPEYLEARRQLFPHGIPTYPLDTRHIWVIFVCDDCSRAEAQWKKQPGH